MRRGLGAVLGGAYGGFEVAVGIDDLQDLAALKAFDEDFDVAVGQLEALNDVDDGADLIDLVGLGLVDTGVVLGGEKNLLVAGQSFFQGADAGLPADHEGRHHEGKDDDVADGHHGELFGLEFLSLSHRNHLVMQGAAALGKK